MSAANAAEEEARLGSLNDAVVVGGRECDHLAEAQLGQDAGVGRLETGGVAQCPDTDDGALPGHEARHGLHGAERPGVGQRDGRTGEVVRGDPVGVDLADEVLVGQHEGAEVEGVGILDARHEQRPAPVALLLVDRQTQPHMLVVDDTRLPLAVGVGHEGGVECGHIEQGAHHGVADDVRETHLRPSGPRQLIVQDETVDLEEPRRHGPHAGRRGDGQAGLHVGDDPRGRTAQRGGLLLSRRYRGCRSRGGGRRHGGSLRGRSGRGLGRGRCACRRRGLGLGLRRRDGSGPVVGEELPPALADRVRVGQEAVVHVVDQPGIGAERAPRTAELGHGPTLPATIGSHGQSG